MDPQLIQEGKAVAQPLNHRVHATIPSILAAGEPFALRLTVFGPDELPAEDFTARLTFEDSLGAAGGEGATVEFRAGQRAVCEIDGRFTAAAPGDLRLGGKVHLPGGEAYAWHSNPAWVFDEPPYRLYWGDLHVHTKFSNCHDWACKSPEFGYAYARDLTHLDFCAAADHLHGIASNDNRWPRLQELVREFYRPGRFVPILAFESSHAKDYGGDNNVYFAGEQGPLFWLDREDMTSTSPQVPLQELWAFLEEAGEPFMTAPHHTARLSKYRRFGAGEAYDPRRERFFEIYSAWGTSERPGAEFPLSSGNDDGPSYFLDALKAGCRYGVIASSDDHTTMPGGLTRNWTGPLAGVNPQGYLHMGLAAVRAKTLDRESIWQGLWDRASYGTNFGRALMEVRLGDAQMGEEIELSAKDPLRKRRRIVLRHQSHHPAPVHTYTLLRNGEPIETTEAVPPDPHTHEVVFEDAEPIEQVALRDAPCHGEPFVVYTVRADSVQGHCQWSSPIWLDL